MRTMLSWWRGHYFKTLGILLLAVALATGMTGCSCTNDDNHPGEPTEIADWKDLNDIWLDLNGSYVLVSNLSKTTAGYEEFVGSMTHEKGWRPIGNATYPFKGTFDGGGNTICDLFIYRPEEDEVGLFGRVQEGLIKNIGLVSVNVTGNVSVGALVGYSWGGTLYSDTESPSKTYSHGSVTGGEDVGGLVGNSYRGIVNQCQSSAEVFHLSSISDEKRWRAGGLVGLNSGPVLNCNYNGVVSGDRQVGGLVGQNALALDARVEDCGGKYSVYGNLEVGGVAGCNLGALRRASFNGTVKAFLLGDSLIALNEGVTGNGDSSDAVPLGSYVGGVVGVNNGTVEECTSQGSVRGENCVGGVAGANNGNVEDCGTDSEVSGTDNVGGLVGANGGSYVSRCSSSGDVTGDSNVGGLVGYNGGTVINSHYNYDEVLINGDHMITLGALSGGDFEEWVEGDKSLNVNLSEEDGYYLIDDVQDFKQLLAFGQDAALKFRLTDDLDLQGERNFYIPYLAGEFHGNGHKISNLYLDLRSVSNVGLFGYLAGGTVSELGVLNVNVTGLESVGGIVGWNEEGTVSNSHSTGSVTGGREVGGLVGGNNGTVTSSYAAGSVIGSMNVGGLSEGWGGYESPSSVPGSQFIGGLVGANFGTISNSYSESDVIGTEYVGGLVGLNDGGTVIDSHSSASVTGESMIGCLVGYNTGTLTNCYSECVLPPVPWSA